MSIGISLRFRNASLNEIHAPQAINAGLRIFLDGRELTRYQEHERLNREYERDYEYKEQYIVSHLRNLMDGLGAFKRSGIDPTEPNVYGEQRYELYEYAC